MNHFNFIMISEQYQPQADVLPRPYNHNWFSALGFEEDLWPIR